MLLRVRRSMSSVIVDVTSTSMYVPFVLLHRRGCCDRYEYQQWRWWCSSTMMIHRIRYGHEWMRRGRRYQQWRWWWWFRWRWWFIKLIHRMRYDHNGWEWEEEDVMCWSCFEIWRSDRSNDDVLLGGEGWRRGQLLIEQMQLTYYGLTSNSGMGTNVGATDDGRQLLCCRHYYDDVMTMMVV